MRKRSNFKNKMQKTSAVKRKLHSAMTKEKHNDKAYAAFKAKPYQKRYTGNKQVRKIQEGDELKEQRVESIAQVDMSGLKIPMIAVYEHPENFPDNYVAKIYDADIPTDTLMVKSSLKEIVEDIERNTRKTFIRRGKDDVPSLVGVWI